MENSKETDPVKNNAAEQKAKLFNKNDISIFTEEEGNGKQRFYVQSGEVFDKLKNAIKNALRYFKFKLKNIFKKKSIEEEQYDLTRKLYLQNRKLLKKLKKIESSAEKTEEITTQIKHDTKKIMLDMDSVIGILEYQMERIDDLENYMRENLGSDWLQIKNNWARYKDGEMTRGEFTKLALKKLGKKFLGIFINTV